MYLHYALDIWFEKIVKPHYRGEATITSNGSVSIDAEDLTDVRISDSEGRATLGEGGSTIRLDTSNGDIRVSTMTPE